MRAIGEEAIPQFLREQIRCALGKPRVLLFRRVPFDPFRAAGVQFTAHVEIALFDDVGAAEVVDHDGAVFGHQNIVVPGVAGGVEEDGDVGELVVVLQDVFEVDHCFTAFVAVEM